MGWVLPSQTGFHQLPPSGDQTANTSSNPNDDQKPEQTKARDQAEATVQSQQLDSGGEEEELKAMRGGLFLMLYTVSNLLLLFVCAGYIYLTKDLSTEANDSLIIPQILAVIPGRSCIVVVLYSLCSVP